MDRICLLKTGDIFDILKEKDYPNPFYERCGLVVCILTYSASLRRRRHFYGRNLESGRKR